MEPLEGLLLDVCQYSEWLDEQGLVVGDEDPDADKRSHLELAQAFIASRRPARFAVDSAGVAVEVRL